MPISITMHSSIANPVINAQIITTPASALTATTNLHGKTPASITMDSLIANPATRARQIIMQASAVIVTVLVLGKM
jgi:hypothetical protein